MNKVIINSFLMLALMFATATLVSAAHWTDASPCDEIFFSTFFDVPQTIFISQQLNLRGNLIIHGKGAHLLTIRNIAPPQSNSRIFLVQVNITARIEGLTLSGGRVTNGANGGAILNEGTHAHPTPLTGKIAFETARDGNSEIYLMDMDGRNPIRLTNNPSRDGDPFFSSDGSRIVFPRNREIYVMNVDGTGLTRLTFNTFDDLRPAFSPDGSKIAFYRNTETGSEIYIMNANGTNKVRPTNNFSADEFPKWSPDGTRILFQSNRDGEASFSPNGSKIVFFSDRSGNNEVWVMNADGSQPVNLSNSTSNDGSCSWSADGQKVLFVSSRDGNTEIYLMNADGTGQTRLTMNTVLENTPVSQPSGK